MDHKYPLFCPGDVQDIPNISHTDIVLYANLYGLFQAKGYCWATNEYLSERLKVSERTLQRSLKNLQDLSLITIEFEEGNRRIFSNRPVTPVAPPVTAVTPPRQICRQEGVSSSNNKIKESYADRILDLYRQYPLKKGKTVGLKKLTKQIKSDEDLAQLETAIKNYAAECKGKDPQYIKHFSTFSGCWQDYLETKEIKSAWVTMKIVDGKMVPVTEE